MASRSVPEWRTQLKYLGKHRPFDEFAPLMKVNLITLGFHQELISFNLASLIAAQHRQKNINFVTVIEKIEKEMDLKLQFQLPNTSQI